MNKIINNMSGYPSFAAEVDGDLCITSGYDRPRFANAVANISGYLGFETWADQIPTLNNHDTGGSLDSSKYYSVRLVPISQYIIHQSTFASGTPSGYASFVTGYTGYTFDLPEHDEVITIETAVATAYTSSTVTDSTKAWTTDQWEGYTVRNEENGNTALITANTATVLTFDTDIFQAVGDRISILTPKATGYAVYASQIDSLAGETGATWNFQAYIDYGTAQYILTTFVSGAVMVEDEYFPPENFRICTEGGNRLFAGAGIYYEGTGADIDNFLLDSLGDPITDSDGEYIHTADGADFIENVSGITEGMAGAYLRFDGDPTQYQIESVDIYNQTITLTEDYVGEVVDRDYIIYSDFDLWYSDIKNPHIFRSDNYIEIPDQIRGLIEMNNIVYVFCRNSLYVVPIETLGQAPVKIDDTIVFNAPYSIVDTPKGIFFFDGEGISITNGSEVVSITKYKASDYLEGINKDLIENIRGVYNSSKRRVEFYFAYGEELTNNYGIYITIDSLNCYGSSRVDCNAVWRDIDVNNKPRIYHGTSGRHTTSGYGDVWEHQDELSTDGDLQNEAYSFVVTAVDTGTRTISVSSTGGSTVAASGWSILHISTLYPNYSQLIIDTITETGTSPYTYDIVIGTDWEIDSIAVGDYIIAGGVPYTFGPVWTDFASPVYNHHVRGLQIDTNGFEGLLFVDHYLELEDTFPRDTTVVYMNSSKKHIRIPFKQGAGHSYAFRIRGYGITPIQINSISRFFDPEV